MRNLLLISVAIASALMISCEKDDSENIIESENESNYFPLKTGSYWVYQHYQIDTSGNETLLNKRDSMVISGDTNLHGKTYYIMEGINIPYNTQWEIIDLLRDSNGYIVNHSGEILYSKNNFTDTLVSNQVGPAHILSYKMENPDYIVNVPAGSFNVKNFKGTIVLINPDNNYQAEYPRYLNNYYSDSVGKILETYLFLASPKINEKRLVDYNIPN